MTSVVSKAGNFSFLNTIGKPSVDVVARWRHHNHLPAKASPEIVDPAALLQFRKDRLSDSSREEGLIFWRWLRHEGANNGHVTAQNLEKTRLLLGAGISEYCAEHDISSQWTTDPEKAGELADPRR